MLLALLFLMVSSCGPKEVDKLGEAQACINTATPDEVDGCLEKIEGIQSTGADSLRCAGYFMREGILDAATLVQAFSNLGSESGSTADRMGNFMSLVTFTKSAPDWSTNESRARDTFNVCFQSQGRATTFIATFTSFSASLMNYGSQSAVTIDYANSSQIATTIANSLAALALDILEPPIPGAALGITAAGQTALSNIGSAIIRTFQIACNIPKPIDATMCTEFDNAIDQAGPGASSQSVAEAFLTSIAS